MTKKVKVVLLFAVIYCTQLFNSTFKAQASCTYTIVPIGQVCVGDNVVLSASTTAAFANIQWFQGATPLGANPVTITPTVAGSVVYTVVITAAGCSTTATTTVTAYEDPDVKTLEYWKCQTDPLQPFFVVSQAQYPNNFVTVLSPTDPLAVTAVTAAFPPNDVTYSFNSATAGVGTHIVTVCNDGGCCDTVFFHVAPAPQLTIPSLICVTDEPFTLHPQFMPVEASGLTFIPSVPFIDPFTFEFDPSLAGVGTHVFDACYTLHTGGICCQSYTVTVTSESWHQTTQNAFSRDMTKDVITDNNGDVYVTGFFTRFTTLNGGNNPDINLNSGIGFGATSRSSYVAKYTSCGDLIWESHAVNSADNVGNSIVLDQLNNRVYVAGDMIDRIIFSPQSSCTVAVSSPTSPGLRGYVAAFDMTTGCPEVVEDISLFAYTRSEAITVNENNGDIFVGGSMSGIAGGTPHTSYIRKYSPPVGGTTLGVPGPGIVTTSAAGQDNEVNDMDFREGTPGRLWAIGNYRTNVTFFPPTVGFTLTAPPLSTVDAYLAAFDDGVAAFTFSSIRSGNNPLAMTGEGISVDQITGVPYITGTYRASGTNVFQSIGFTITPTPGSPGDKAYMIRLGPPGPGTRWVKRGWVNNPIAGVNGKSVSFRNNVVYFTGNYTRQGLFLGGFGGPMAYSPASGFNAHTYVAAYTNTGSSVFRNATADQLPANNNSVHFVESIYAGVNGMNFVTGFYSGILRIDQFTTSPLADLQSTGSPVHTNGFILRVNGSAAGAFSKLTADSDQENDIVSDDASLVSVYPNPTNSQLTIAINNYKAENKTYKITLYNSIGQEVQRLNVTGEKTIIDMSAYENGIYLLSFSDGNSLSTVRVSKTD